MEGGKLGASVGRFEGEEDGLSVGDVVGLASGLLEGVGVTGVSVGLIDGDVDGLLVVGEAVGLVCVSKIEKYHMLVQLNASRVNEKSKFNIQI